MTQAYVYFDPNSGLIRGISMVQDAHLACWPHIRVGTDIAFPLMSGEVDLTGHFVIPNPDTGEHELRDLSPVAVTRGEYILVREPRGHPFAFQLDIVATKVGVSVHRRGHKINCAGEFVVLVTGKGNQDRLLLRCVVDVDQLNDTGVFTHKEFIDEDEVDIYATSMSPFVIVGTFLPLALEPLPSGRFEDFEPISFKAVKKGLVVTYEDGALTFTLKDGGGTRYDRSLSTLDFFVSEPNNVDNVFFHTRVEIEQLKEGPVTVGANIPPVCQAYIQRFFLDNSFHIS